MHRYATSAVTVEQKAIVRANSCSMAADNIHFDDVAADDHAADDADVVLDGSNHWCVHLAACPELWPS